MDLGHPHRIPSQMYGPRVCGGTVEGPWELQKYVGTVGPLWANYKPPAHAAFDMAPVRAPEVKWSALPPGRILSMAPALMSQLPHISCSLYLASFSYTVVDTAVPPTSQGQGDPLHPPFYSHTPHPVWSLDLLAAPSCELRSGSPLILAPLPLPASSRHSPSNAACLGSGRC